ncbi:hypothetical protein EDB85DRAFT_1893734 [Lactarius pseudohatsudake]|nr:hypothetical protein EDB85DRAFT_1893734 [Lactarius pseudohatsudake]
MAWMYGGADGVGVMTGRWGVARRVGAMWRGLGVAVSRRVAGCCALRWGDMAGGRWRGLGMAVSRRVACRVGVAWGSVMAGALRAALKGRGGSVGSCTLRWGDVVGCCAPCRGGVGVSGGGALRAMLGWRGGGLAVEVLRAVLGQRRGVLAVAGCWGRDGSGSPNGLQSKVLRAMLAVAGCRGRDKWRWLAYTKGLQCPGLSGKRKRKTENRRHILLHWDEAHFKLQASSSSFNAFKLMATYTPIVVIARGPPPTARATPSLARDPPRGHRLVPLPHPPPQLTTLGLDPSPRLSHKSLSPPPLPPLHSTQPPRKTHCNATPTRRAIPAAKVDDDGDVEGCSGGNAKDDGNDSAEGAGTTGRRERRQRGVFVLPLLPPPLVPASTPRSDMARNTPPPQHGTQHLDRQPTTMLPQHSTQHLAATDPPYCPKMLPHPADPSRCLNAARKVLAHRPPRHPDTARTTPLPADPTPPTDSPPRQPNTARQDPTTADPPHIPTQPSPPTHATPPRHGAHDPATGRFTTTTQHATPRPPQRQPATRCQCSPRPQPRGRCRWWWLQLIEI